MPVQNKLELETVHCDSAAQLPILAADVDTDARKTDLPDLLGLPAWVACRMMDPRRRQEPRGGE
jgi:hypothetical protein